MSSLMPPILIADHGILGLRNGEFADVVGRDSLEEGDSASSGDSHPPHMAHIEEPDMGTDGMVLVHDSAVLDGHLPSGEIDEFGAAGLMLLDEGSLLHYGLLMTCRLNYRTLSNSTSKIKVACRRNHATGALCAIPELGRNGQLSLSSHFHALDALIPSLDDSSSAQRKRERLASVHGTVEFASHFLASLCNAR